MELTSRACDVERLHVERFSARVFATLGGIFWAVASFGGDYFYQGTGLGEAIGGAVLPLTLAVAALAIGWFYERVAAIGLGAGAVAMIAWGIAAGWELGPWLGMSALVIGPTIIAAVLFWFAARMEGICEREGTE